MIIIGAGMAGLLAGGMIRNAPVTIYESAKDLPNNHSAVLRFRTSIVGDVLGIEFKSVKMMKCAQSWRNPVADNLAYSMKCNGKATLRSMISANAELQTRFIAPRDLIKLMAERVNGKIEFNSHVSKVMIEKSNEPIISTVPMPALMDLLEYPDKPQFNYVNGMNVNAIISNMDAYASVYIPDPESAFNRISATGDRLTAEYSYPNSSASEIQHIIQLINERPNQATEIVKVAAEHLGIMNPKIERVAVSNQKYSKILPIDEGARKRFIMWASDKFNVYSLGRFATWRPGLLLDDLVQDVRVIQKIITQGNYDHRKK